MRGHTHRARVLTAERVAAPPRVAEGLMLTAGAPVSHVLVVHYENDAPIQMEDRYVCESFAPRMLEQNFSLVTPSEYLSGILPLQEAEHIVRAISPDDAVRARLQMGDEEPCLLVTRRTWAKGRPVTFVQLFHPGSRFELTGHFVPPGTNGSNYENKLRNLNL